MGQLSVPNFEKGEGGAGVGGIQKKNECLGGTYRVQVINICQAGFTMFLVKKSLLNVKFGFEGSISNVGYGLF